MQKLDELFSEWEKYDISKGRNHFIEDGIVNEDIWFRQDKSKRICFFLKEAYLLEEDKSDNLKWNLAKALNDGFLKRMWHSVADWTYGIQNTTENCIPAYITLSNEAKIAELHKISVVNCKKSSGKSKTDWNEIERIVSEEAIADFIRNELKIIDPGIIVCGNNAILLYKYIFKETDGGLNQDEFRKMLDSKHFCRWNDILIIDFYHPANQYPKFMNYYSLCAVYQQALMERK